MIGDVVRQAFSWVGTQAVPAGGGSLWREDGADSDDLYSGTAGVLLGCAEAAAAGFDPPAAGPARDRLVHLATRDDHCPPASAEGGWDDGMFGGWAGVAVALRAWARVTGDKEAEAAAATVVEGIAARVLARPDDPARCTDVISGDAGILLALIEQPAPAAAVEAAARVADGLPALAEAHPEGPQWRMTPDRERLLPGFSHGAAGVAYALARAAGPLGRPGLRAVAERAADGLITLGNRPGGWALPLMIPPKPDPPHVNFGWCHGPTGIIRLFLLLGRTDATAACLQALRDSRLPARLYPGYWDNVARCCGTAGVGSLLLDRYHATGDPLLLAWAQELADDVLDRRITADAGVTWSNTEHTVDPPELAPQPGFMQGTAGIAGWLARLAAPHTPPVLGWL